MKSIKILLILAGILAILGVGLSIYAVWQSQKTVQKTKTSLLPITNEPEPTVNQEATSVENVPQRVPMNLP